MTMLQVEKMTKEFGGLRVIDTLDLTIKKGMILGLIGPNGAGKSTAFNCIAGSFASTAGEITFDGERITGEKPWNLCKMGLARTFQIVKPFASDKGCDEILIDAEKRSIVFSFCFYCVARV